MKYMEYWARNYEQIDLKVSLFFDIFNNSTQKQFGKLLIYFKNE